VAPLLRPVEKMDKEQLAAAAGAYEAYRRRRGLPTESSPSWFEG
jgi:hypothetical protein